VRILEAFSRAVPVVTTTVGLEGIEAVPERDVLVADTPGEFSDAVVRLLENPQLQAQLAANSRNLALSTYDWQVVLRELEAVYTAAEQSRSS
jgi:polysaccharide biosynthesis protein PslH